MTKLNKKATTFQRFRTFLKKHEEKIKRQIQKDKKTERKKEEKTERQKI